LSRVKWFLKVNLYLTMWRILSGAITIEMDNDPLIPGSVEDRHRILQNIVLKEWIEPHPFLPPWGGPMRRGAPPSPRRGEMEKIDAKIGAKDVYTKNAILVFKVLMWRKSNDDVEDILFGRERLGYLFLRPPNPWALQIFPCPVSRYLTPKYL